MKQREKKPTHNFKMSWQWEALARAKASLKPGEQITEQDYQMNITVAPFGTSCASKMTADERQEALFPVVGYTREKEGGNIVKLAGSSCRTT